MNVIRIPLCEDLVFERQLKAFILHQIDSLYREYKEWPDRIILSGKLGRHLFNIFNKNKWSFDKINVLHENGSNVMIIEFTRNINVKKDSNFIHHTEDSIDGKTVDGWKGEGFSNAMNRYSPNMNFNIEKTESPKIIIKLKELSL